MNGNAIDVYEDGTLAGTYTITSGASNIEDHCIASTTTAVEFVFVDGSWNSEVSFEILEGQMSYGTAVGSGTYDIIWNGTTYTDGDTFLSLPSVFGGTDADDNDANVQ